VGWSSVHHVKSLDGATEVRSIGKNDRGQLAPSVLRPLRALAAGSEHCIGIDYAGQLIAWGWGEHGNCGEQVDDRGTVSGRYNVIPVASSEDGIVVEGVAAGCATSFVICGKKG
jgi:protein ATS1